MYMFRGMDLGIPRGLILNNGFDYERFLWVLRLLLQNIQT